jgi:hypothetical protein
MTENATMTDHTTGDSEPLAARIRDLLRRYNPIYLAPLAFLSLPVEFVDQLAFLEIFEIFWLFFLWIFIGPLVDLALRTQIEEESEPTDWIGAGGPESLVVFILTMPLAFLNPLVLLQDLTQFAGGALAAVRHRGSLPDVESYEQSVEYRLPFDGEWTVVNGSPEQEYSHSWIYPNQRYAYDFLITDEDARSKSEGAGSTVEEYYCYDEPVLAPADGVVVDAFDAALESTRAGGFSHPASRDIRGGYVVIKHAAEEYSLLAHLKPGSVPVAVGERVERGQEVGRCGHSGNSSEPHLHFQVQDHPSFEFAVSLPVQFDTVEIESPGVAHDEDLIPGATLSDGVHENSYIVAGQRVSHAGDAFEDGEEADAGESGAVDVATETETGVSSGADETERSVGIGGWSVTRTARLATLGFGVAGILLFVARIILSGWPLVGVLAGASAVGLAFGLVHRLRHGRAFKTRSLGVPLGLGVAAIGLAGLSSAGVGTGVVVGVLVVGGFLGYFLLGEVERWRLSGVGLALS